MIVSQYMSTDLVKVGPGTSLIVVSDLMHNHDVRHVLVVDSHGELVGVVSQRDILRASLSTDNSGLTQVDVRHHLGTVIVDAVMKTDIKAVDPRATVQTAARLMLRSKIGCLPVVDSRKLVGVISEYDLLAFVEALPETTSPISSGA
jgi:acetoin utilization protein AcuB